MWNMLRRKVASSAGLLCGGLRCGGARGVPQLSNAWLFSTTWLLPEWSSRRALSCAQGVVQRTQGAVGDDPYRTRTAAPHKLVPRVDPVVWPRDSSFPLSTSPVLSDDEVAKFDQNGFVILRGVIGKDEADRCLEVIHSWNAAFEEGSLSCGVCTVSECVEDRTLLRSVFSPHICDKSGKIGQLPRNPRILGAAEQLLGSQVYIHQARINLQPALHGSGFYWHSDFETWHAEDGMPAPRALSAAIMLTANKDVNGSLQVIPGSHRHYVACRGDTPEENWMQSLKQQYIGVPDPRSLDTLVENTEIKLCTGDVGDVVLFDSNIMHGSSSNVSPFARINAFFVLNSVANRLEDPFYAPSQRPEHIGHRLWENTRALEAAPYS